MNGNLDCPKPAPRFEVAVSAAAQRRHGKVGSIAILGKANVVFLFVIVCFFQLSTFVDANAAEDEADTGQADTGQADTGQADTGQIEGLIVQLGNDDFERRELAQAALERIGPPARAALAKASNHADFEIAWRARYLLDRIHVRWTRKTDAPEVRTLFERYQYLSPGERIARVDIMRMFPDEIRVVALTRVARFESNESISKLAALALLGSRPMDIVNRSGAEFASDLLRARMAGADPFAFQMRNPRAPVQVPLGRMGGMNFDLTELAEPLGAPTPKDASKAKELDAGELAALAEKELEGCDRPGPTWIRTGLRFDATRDAEAFLTTWKRLRAAEEARADSEDATEDPLRAAISEEMLWYETGALFRLDRREEALAAARRLMEKASLGPSELDRLVTWFTHSQQTKLLEELAETRSEAFAHDPLLLYRIAEGLKKSGDEERAEVLAERAFQLSPVAERNGAVLTQDRPRVAMALCDRGLIAWAEREMEYILDRAQPRGMVIQETRRLLANLRFEDDRPLDAAKCMDELLEANKHRSRVDPRLRPFRADRDYYYARHYEKTGDHAKKREYVLKALETNAEESLIWVDILIAAWQLEDLPDDVRKDVKTRVEAMLASNLRGINAKPSEAGNYNNYAWLAANTKLGDLRQAIAFSEKSLKLDEDNYAYWDTLAHCHYAAGNLEEAVKCQEKAAKLAPTRKIITSKLAFLHKELDAAKKRKTSGEAPASPPVTSSPATSPRKGGENRQ